MERQATMGTKSERSTGVGATGQPGAATVRALRKDAGACARWSAIPRVPKAKALARWA